MKKRTVFFGLAVIMVVNLGLIGFSDYSASNVAAANESISKKKISTKSKQKSKQVTLDFWMSEVTPERNQLLEKIINSFEKKNPNIKINYLGIPGNSNDVKSKFDMAIAAGQVPDIIFYFDAQYIQRGIYEPLDAYFNKWAEKNKINKALVDANRALDSKEKKLYAMPVNAIVFLMWMRSDWFKSENLPIPQTWDDFFAAAKKLTNKSMGRYGVSIRGGYGGAQNLEFFMYSYSGLTETFTKNGKSTINHPKHIEFVNKYLSLYGTYSPEDDLGKGWTELAATFQSGKAAMIAHNLGSAVANEKAFNNDYSKFEAVNYPKGVNGYRTHPRFLATGFAMTKKSKHKKEAWNFLTFLTSADNNLELVKLVGGIPANSDAANSEWIAKKPYMNVANELINDQSTHYFKEPTYLPSYRTILSETAEPLMQQAMIKQITAKEFLDKWAAALENAKKEYDASFKK